MVIIFVYAVESCCFIHFLNKNNLIDLNTAIWLADPPGENFGYTVDFHCLEFPVESNFYQIYLSKHVYYLGIKIGSQVKHPVMEFDIFTLGYFTCLFHNLSN